MRLDQSALGLLPRGLFSGSRTRHVLLFTLLFFAVQMPVLISHELWRDEIQAWSIVAKSESLTGLWNNTKYEGHPKLWFYLLYLLQQITPDIAFMKLLHLSIATMVVLVVLTFSPFGLRTNLLMCGGYFFAYEYSVISRNYAIGILLLFLATGIFLKYRGRCLLLLSAVLCLAFQTNAYAAILSGLLFGYILWELLASKEVPPSGIAFPVLIGLAGVGISFASASPPADGGFAAGWGNDISLDSLGRTFATIERSFVPLPAIKTQFWNTNILDGIRGQLALQCSLSALLLLATGFYLRHDRKVCALFVLGVSSILLFTLVKYFGYLRHHGHMFILFLLCAWLIQPSTQFVLNSDKANRSVISATVGSRFVTGLLVLQVIAASFAGYFELTGPFSNAEKAARFLQSREVEAGVVGDKDYATSAVAGLLAQDFYYPASGTEGTYITWNDSRKDVSYGALLANVDRVARRARNDAVVVLSYPLWPEPKHWHRLAQFSGAIVADENFYLYTVSAVKN